LKIKAEDVVPFNQIEQRVVHGNEVLFSTVPGANDPGITLRLREPFDPGRIHRVFTNSRFWAVIAIAPGIGLILIILQTPLSAAASWALPLLRHMNQRFAKVAHLASQQVAPIDTTAIWFLSICGAVLLLAACLDLNGSSSGALPLIYQHGAEAKIWIGFPKQARADEWGYETPDILNQCLRRDHFAIGNSQLGPRSVALTGCVPVKHISTLFRPQYWAFFLLPVDYAFAFFWQCKAVVLIIGLFCWLLMLTRSTLWSITGTLWYFYSPLNQWAYSWPTALPETIGFLLFGTVLACSMTIERRALALAIESLGLAICVIEFALSAYVPLMIPLFWVAAFSFIGWCISNRHLIFKRECAARRLLAIGLAAVVIGAVGISLFLDLHTALNAIANTVYPGRRVLNGGTTRWSVLLSSFLSWTQTETNVPAALGNICEGSSYLWLAPPTLFLLFRLKLSNYSKWMLAALWLSFSLLLAWLVVPIPAAIGGLFGLDRTFGARVFPALGLANVAIVVLCGAELCQAKVLIRHRWLWGALGFAALLLLLRAVNRDLDRFFSRREVLFAALFVGALIYLFLARRKFAFAALLVLPQAFIFGRVNPVERGLSVYLDSDLRKFTVQHPALLNGKWMMFSDAVVNSGFLAATGAEVYTGTHYLPDIDHFAVYSANHLDLNLINRDGYLDAHLRTPSEPLKLELPSPVIVQLDVRPGDPILKQLGIKYLAFDRLPDPAALALLSPLSEKPVDGFWLYELR